MKDYSTEKLGEFRKRTMRILDQAPQIKDILLSGNDLESKRHQMRTTLTGILTAAYDETPDTPSLEWVLTRDAVEAWQNLCSRRNEALANFSFLAYLDALVNSSLPGDQPPPTTGFFAELDHLVRGITHKTSIYPDNPPAFLKHQGQKAASLRSTDLSRMAKSGSRFMERYACGLDSNVIRRRSRNKSRILKHFNATELEWNNWKWHCRNIIRDADTLASLVRISDEEYKAVKTTEEAKVPFGITPYYLTLLDNRPDSPHDKAIRAQVLPSLNYVQAMSESREQGCASMDFMLEHDTSPIEAITRRYPNIVILKPVLTCPQICVYCQRNWQIKDVHSKTAAVNTKVINRAIDWIAQKPEINEVLITGGDPFLLANSRIEQLLRRLSSNPNIIRIRIGTRTPVTLPQRVTDSLAKIVSRYHIPGKREVIIVTHFEHPYEITPEAMEATQKFRRSSIDVYNQLVYTFFNSRKFEASALRQKLRLIGVTPYYTFNTKGKEETDDFRVPIARLLQEQKEEARLLPGTARTDEVVFNVPRLGKNYLDSSQHHNIISILPDGRRVYEFHPWEKKLALVDTYVYTDVSIHDYLMRLKNEGENVRDYRSIWYYY